MSRVVLDRGVSLAGVEDDPARLPPMRLILYSRAGCHLCDRLEQAIRPSLVKRGLALEKRDIDAEPNWKLLFGQRIPVLTCDGDVILEGNPSDAAIAQAMRMIAV